MESVSPGARAAEGTLLEGPRGATIMTRPAGGSDDPAARHDILPVGARADSQRQVASAGSRARADHTPCPRRAGARAPWATCDRSAWRGGVARPRVTKCERATARPPPMTSSTRGSARGAVREREHEHAQEARSASPRIAALPGRLHVAGCARSSPRPASSSASRPSSPAEAAMRQRARENNGVEDTAVQRGA